MEHALKEPASRSFAAFPAGAEDLSGTGAEMETGRRVVMESLSATPVTVDEIVRQCQLSPSMVSLILLELELAGRIERHPGHQVSLAA